MTNITHSPLFEGFVDELDPILTQVVERAHLMARQGEDANCYWDEIWLQVTEMTRVLQDRQPLLRTQKTSLIEPDAPYIDSDWIIRQAALKMAMSSTFDDVADGVTEMEKAFEMIKQTSS